MVLSKKRIAKALIRLRGCAGWSAPVLFANTRRQVFSRRGPYGVWLLLESAAIPLEVQHKVPGDWLVLENLIHLKSSCDAGDVSASPGDVGTTVNEPLC